MILSVRSYFGWKVASEELTLGGDVWVRKGHPREIRGRTAQGRASLGGGPCRALSSMRAARRMWLFVEGHQN